MLEALRLVLRFLERRWVFVLIVLVLVLFYTMGVPKELLQWVKDIVSSIGS
jgi:hypothetical protein